MNETKLKTTQNHKRSDVNIKMFHTYVCKLLEYLFCQIRENISSSN